MAQAIKNGQCLARCLETQALDSTGFLSSGQTAPLFNSLCHNSNN